MGVCNWSPDPSHPPHLLHRPALRYALLGQREGGTAYHSTDSPAAGADLAHSRVRSTDVPVKKGQPLFQFDRRPYEYQVNQLQAQLHAAAANVSISRYKITQLQAELAAAKQDVRMFKADVEAATEKIDRSRSELEYAKYQSRLSQGLALKGAGPEEDAQKIG